ncbi:putative component of ABC transporter [Leucobacter sp. 7(1)]|uniref:sugar ABC transporter substrate-binding protein n=1 Tax=Leucobacter sp. 7(1) TaxID=1255613 RepID=UPI00097F5412|nr:sugar ABC transporter substrate-binding protein [Leucobacter sp. 7(1)]SJN11808.1 putative component of ABC transporter [Leucobacter sp. 7(1)]
MFTKKRLAAGAMLGVAVLALVGCASAAPEAGGAAGGEFGDVSVAYGSPGEAAEFEVTISDGVEEVAKEVGVGFKLYNNKDDGEIALTNAQLMVQGAPDVIVEYSLTSGVNQALGNTFTASGIPCIAVNVETPGCSLINLSNRKAGEDAAKIMAAEALSRGWTAADTSVLAVQCATCGTEVNDSPRYFYTQAAADMGLEQVKPEEINEKTTVLGANLNQVDGGTARDTAYDSVKAALQAIPKDRHLMVFSPNDDLTLGAWRALDEAGRNDNTLIGGNNGSSEGLDQLRSNPSWVVEGTMFLPQWGQYVIAMAVAVANGATPPDLTPLPQYAMDKKTVEEYYPGDATVAVKLPPLEPEAEYLAESGVLQKLGFVEGLD